jgi:undecaprenyl phosphate N,N'-diacetylbacillosamine 1-phosphate transferase
MLYKNYLKSLFDFITALAGLIVLSPIFILVTTGLFFANNGTPFFLQTRPGKNEKLFRIVKFKT